MDAQEYTFRSLLPPQPLQWLLARARLYLLILGATILGFFFVAAWMAEPDARRGWFDFTSPLRIILVTVYVIAAYRQRPRRHTGRHHEKEGQLRH